jgi:hypothetical protein
VLAASWLVLAGCGGGNSPEAKTAGSAHKSDENATIGEPAVAQGGLTSLSDAGAGVAEASPGTLRMDMLDKDTPVKLDGVLSEWPARTNAGVVLKGGSQRLAFSLAVQYDATRLYVGGDVTDASFFRTDRFADGEDHASLLIAFPTGGGSFGSYEVGLFAGKPGETEGQVRFIAPHRGQVAGSKIVEAPTAKGYSFEAVIPWSAFPESHTVRVGLRGAARYYDSDGSATARNVVATATGESSAPSSLPPLLTEPEESLLEGLLSPNNLSGTAPKVDLLADVAGDAMKERIAVFDHFIAICGPGYHGGKEYFYRDLGAELVRLEAREITGRGKADIILRRRFPATAGGSGGAAREWFEVWSLIGGDEPVTTFAHEISVTRGSQHVANSVHAGKGDIEVAVEPAAGWDASSYQEPTASDVEPVLLPWGGVRSQSFRFDGSRFMKAREVKQAATVTPGATPALAVLKPAEPATPPQQRGGDLARQLLDQYKRDRGVPADAKPKVDISVNVDGDTRAERVVLMGRDIVVFGPGFNGGNQYAVITLQQFADPADVTDLTARDLTGDGAADLVVRGVRHVTAAGAADPVDVEGLFIYRVSSASISRVFSIETGRASGSKRVQGLVQFVPSKDGKSFEIDVRPGRATGWNRKTYPWAQDQPGGGALEPLLLPWGGIPSLRYGWNGSQFATR